MPRPKSAIPNQELLQAALEGLEIQKQRLQDQIQRVQSLLGKRRGRPAAAESTASAPVKRRRRRLSAAGRKRIAEAQRRRWAALRKNAGGEKKAAK